jgi:carboxypeptidase C (cathepsin A)
MFIALLALLYATETAQLVLPPTSHHPQISQTLAIESEGQKEELHLLLPPSHHPSTVETKFRTIRLLAPPTSHQLHLDSGTVSYKATIGERPILNQQGEEVASICFIAYTSSHPDKERPITFVFNGGPGSSSIWLHMGAFGPRRILSPEEGQSPTPPYKVVDNRESLLDLTDLVFIDPVGTGFSRPNSAYCTTEADIRSVGEFIWDYLTETQRWNSPKYLAGESYGATRAVGLADHLQEQSLYFNGLILISSALDFQTGIFQDDNLLPHILYLPTYTATAWYHGRYQPGTTLEEAVHAARNFALNRYAPWLLAGGTDPSIYPELATFTGLPLEVVARLKGRVSDQAFLLEFDPKQLLGQADSRFKGPYTDRARIEYHEDPSITAIRGIFRGGLESYLQQELLVSSPPRHYEMMGWSICEAWDYCKQGPGYFSVVPKLRRVLVANPQLKLFVASGYYDLATPFATSEFCLNQLPQERLQQGFYEGGHMFYLNPSARQKFRQQLQTFYRGAIPNI